MVVVDASAALSWLLADERDAASAAMLHVILKGGAVVPALWRWEIQNGLLYAQRRARATSEDIAAIFEDIEALPLEIDARETTGMGAEFMLAQRFGLTAYDAAYLELAIRRNLKLMARDRDLSKAANEMGLLWAP